VALFFLYFTPRASSARLLRLPPDLEGRQPGLRRQHLVHRHPHGQRQRDRWRPRGYEVGVRLRFERRQCWRWQGRTALGQLLLLLYLQSLT